MTNYMLKKNFILMRDPRLNLIIQQDTVFCVGGSHNKSSTNLSFVRHSYADEGSDCQGPNKCTVVEIAKEMIIWIKYVSVQPVQCLHHMWGPTFHIMCANRHILPKWNCVEETQSVSIVAHQKRPYTTHATIPQPQHQHPAFALCRIYTCSLWLHVEVSLHDFASYNNYLISLLIILCRYILNISSPTLEICVHPR